MKAFLGGLTALGMILFSGCAQSDMEALAKLSMGQSVDYVEGALGEPSKESYEKGNYWVTWQRDYDEIHHVDTPGRWEKIYNHRKKRYEDVYIEGECYDEIEYKHMFVKGMFPGGKMTYIQYSTNISGPTFDVWRDANRTLIDWLDANTFGDVEELRKIYAQNPYLNSGYYHMQGAAEAAQNDQAEVVAYYVMEKGISLDSPVSAWVASGSVSGNRGTFYAARKSVRQYAYDAGAQKVIQYLNGGGIK